MHGDAYPEIRDEAFRATTRQFEADGFRRYLLTIPRGTQPPETVIIFCRRCPADDQVIMDGRSVLYGRVTADVRLDVGDVLPVLADETGTMRPSLLHSHASHHMLTTPPREGGRVPPARGGSFAYPVRLQTSAPRRAKLLIDPR